MSDTEMIDWLEKFISDNEVIVLHSGIINTYGYPGLGLRVNHQLQRTLRQAIESAARYQPSSRVKPK